MSEWNDQLFELLILELLRKKGFSSVNEKALELLKSIITKKALNLMSKSKKFA